MPFQKHSLGLSKCQIIDNFQLGFFSKEMHKIKALIKSRVALLNEAVELFLFTLTAFWKAYILEPVKFGCLDSFICTVLQYIVKWKVVEVLI